MTPTSIPCADPRAGYLAHRGAIDAAIRRVLESGCYVLGPEVEAFEDEIAASLGVAHAVGVSSGTAAITLALRALGVGVGDEVVTVSNTALATVAAIERTGAVPVLVDVCPDRWVATPDHVAAAIGGRTRAVVLVHLYGNPAAAPAIRSLCDQANVALVEDCAQAQGATLDGRSVGCFGHAGAFSFYPTKNLGAFGDGGLVATDDRGLDARLRRLRAYGWDAERVSREVGENARLDELQAAILRVRLTRLDAMVAARRALSARYDAAFEGLPLARQRVEPGAQHARHLYVVRTPDRDALRAHLALAGVAAGVHYDRPAHRHPGYQASVRCGPLPVTEALADEVLSLPLFPELSTGDQERVIDAVQSFFSARGRTAPGSSSGAWT